MSPEQVQGRPLDGRTDIFSLGCVIYEMLTGRAPFERDSFGESMAAILKDPVPPFAASSVPAALERAVLRCLEKPREGRFPSAQEIGAALKAAASDTTPSGQRPQSRSGPTVAVLPFRNLPSDAESDFFADGVTEDVIAHLAKIRSISVISRTSVAAFKKHDLSLREIGMRLGATTVVEGSVRRFGNRVRIVAQLTATEEDRHLWAETYDRDLTDIFAIQTDVALSGTCTAILASLR
jgi:serine/threonine-protein kinase